MEKYKPLDISRSLGNSLQQSPLNFPTGSGWVRVIIWNIANRTQYDVDDGQIDSIGRYASVCVNAQASLQIIEVDRIWRHNSHFQSRHSEQRTSCARLCMLRATLVPQLSHASSHCREVCVYAHAPRNAMRTPTISNRLKCLPVDIQLSPMIRTVFT
jgi:hypothetical protein